jgi:hypothetical protein
MTEEARRAYQVFGQNGFLPIGKEQYPLFKSYEDTMLQERSAVIVTSWAQANNGIFKIIHGYLCHLYFYDELPVYFVIHRPRSSPPGTPAEEQLLDSLYGLAMEAGLPFLQIRYVEDRFLKYYEAVEGYDLKIEYRDIDNEYAYRIEDLLELTGTSNYYKRKRIKKFMDMPDIFLRPITKENISICASIQEQWCSQQDCEYCGYFCGCEKMALQVMIDIFDDRTQQGLLLYQKEIPVGYIICEKITKTLGFLYFGKVIIPDGFVYLIYMMFKEHLTGIDYMNMNDEMGNLGLRQFKIHLSAHELWRRNICTFTKKGEENCAQG